MKPLNIAYFGTPSFAAYILEELITDATLPLDIRLVVTQPDKPVGKKQILTPSPVKKIALHHNIPVYDGSAKNSELISLLKSDNIDVVLLFAYGEIITQALLEVPTFGFWNIHPSLLPKYRGASPIAFPLLTGEKETGVSLMLMDEKLDHGPIIKQVTHTINDSVIRSELETELTQLSLHVVKEEFIKLAHNYQMPFLTDQHHTNATFTTMLHKNDGYIPFENLHHAIRGNQDSFIPHLLQKYLTKNASCSVSTTSTQNIYNLYRALNPWPGIWTTVQINGQEKRLKITNVEIKNGRLCINKVQLEGKNEVDITTFNAAYKVF